MKHSNTCSCPVALELTQSLTEISTRTIHGGSKSLPARKAAKLTVSQPYKPPQPVIGFHIALLFHIM
jgi:hypothetical protein